MSCDTVRNMTVGQALEIQDACRRQDITLADLKILTSGNNLRRSLDFLNNAAPAETRLAESFTITVDYTQSLTAMIKAGNYDWTNSDITQKWFPVKGEGQIELTVQIVHLNRNVSSEEAVKEIEQLGLRPARIEELLAFGAKYPEEQRKYPIIALGSVAKVDGNRYVPYLLRHGSERYLYLYWWSHDWHGSYRFLAVRN